MARESLTRAGTHGVAFISWSLAECRDGEVLSVGSCCCHSPEPDREYEHSNRKVIESDEEERRRKKTVSNGDSTFAATASQQHAASCASGSLCYTFFSRLLSMLHSLVKL